MFDRIFNGKLDSAYKEFLVQIWRLRTAMPSMAASTSLHGWLAQWKPIYSILTGHCATFRGASGGEELSWTPLIWPVGDIVFLERFTQLWETLNRWHRAVRHHKQFILRPRTRNSFNLRSTRAGAI